MRDSTETARGPALVALLLACSAAPALAQVDSAFWAALPPGGRLMVELAAGGRLEARVRAIDAAAVHLRAVLRPSVTRAEFADTAVPHHVVSGVLLRNGTHWRRGAIVGAAAVTVWTAVLMVTFWGDNDVPFDESKAPLGLVAAAAVGGLVGAGGGSLIMRWRRVWPVLDRSANP